MMAVTLMVLFFNTDLLYFIVHCGYDSCSDRPVRTIIIHEQVTGASICKKYGEKTINVNCQVLAECKTYIIPATGCGKLSS